MSLRKQLEGLEAGENLVTEQRRTAVYTAAKRAGVTVSTRPMAGGKTEVTVTGGQAPQAELPTVSILLEQLRALPIEERLEILRKFEPCCAARKGACVCDVATNQKQIYFDNLPDNVPLSKLCTMCCEEPCICWEWNPHVQMMRDEASNEYLRSQRKEIAPEEFIYRVVRVDEDDYERIMEVKQTQIGNRIGL